MAAEQLQQLRDIHLPEAPGWWPPAPGWWLLALLIALAVTWLIWRAVWRARLAQRRRRPILAAQRLYAEVYHRYRNGELTSREYLDQSNELVKRVLIHGLGERDARRASGQAWLELLDRHLEEPAFTQGAGRLLGDARFQPALEVDATVVHPLLERLLGRLAAPRGSRP